MGKPKINVALIGYKFMGKAHSNAFRQVTPMMRPDVEPVMKLLVGRTPDALRAAAEEYGWQETSTDWRDAVNRADIDLVDICTANDTHKEIALAACQGGQGGLLREAAGDELAGCHGDGAAPRRMPASSIW